MGISLPPNLFLCLVCREPKKVENHCAREILISTAHHPKISFYRSFTQCLGINACMCSQICFYVQCRGLKLKYARGPHFDEKRACGPHNEAKMSPRAKYKCKKCYHITYNCSFNNKKRNFYDNAGSINTSGRPHAARRTRF